MDDAASARVASRAATDRAEPLPGPSAQIHPRDGLPVSIYEFRRAAPDWQLVEARIARHLLSSHQPARAIIVIHPCGAYTLMTPLGTLLHAAASHLLAHRAA